MRHPSGGYQPTAPKGQVIAFQPPRTPSAVKPPRIVHPHVDAVDGGSEPTTLDDQLERGLPEVLSTLLSHSIELSTACRHLDAALAHVELAREPELFDALKELNRRLHRRERAHWHQMVRRQELFADMLEAGVGFHDVLRAALDEAGKARAARDRERAFHEVVRVYLDCLKTLQPEVVLGKIKSAFEEYDQ